MSRSFAAIAGATLATAGGKSESRKDRMRAVFAACKRLGLDDDARHDLQLGATGKASMAEMDLADFGKLLDRLNQDYKGPTGHRAHIAKVRALWWSLYWLGAVDQPDNRAIDAFVARQTGISALRFLDHRQAHSVIEALKSWTGREGVEWPVAGDPVAERRAVATAIWRKLLQCASIGNISMEAYVGAAMTAPATASVEWSPRTWDDAIRLLGKRLRKEKGKS